MLGIVQADNLTEGPAGPEHLYSIPGNEFSDAEDKEVQKTLVLGRPCCRSGPGGILSGSVVAPGA